MDSSPVESDTKTELNDSGYVHDDATPHKPPEVQTSLLDLSDDVLLYILYYCSPMDLKALGYSCSRLGQLVRDRTLWIRVDARREPYGHERLQWLLNYTINQSTTELLLAGFARETDETQGTDVTLGWQEWQNARCSQIDYQAITWPRRFYQPHGSGYLHRVRISNTIKLDCYLSPKWTKDESIQCNSPLDMDESNQGDKPLYTINSMEMERLKRISNLTSLALEYCNIDCNMISLSNFPPNLKKLSIRGTKCFNQRVDKTFLFRISDFLPKLEYLDVSECQWMEPVSLMTLSKMAHLESLLMCDCQRLSEFVAYASLSMRYGFRNLKSLDVRWSPVGNSEVTALGWLPSLQRLRLAAPRHKPDKAGPTGPAGPALHAWERHVPEYFKGARKIIKSEITPEEDQYNAEKEKYRIENCQDKEQQTDEERERPKRKKGKGNASEDQPESSKRPKRNLSAGPSTKYGNSSDSDSDDNDNTPSRIIYKTLMGNPRNFRIGTIMNMGKPPSLRASTSNSSNAAGNSNQPRMESYVRFRQNEVPVIINCPAVDNENANGSNENSANNDNVNLSNGNAGASSSNDSNSNENSNNANSKNGSSSSNANCSNNEARNHDRCGPTFRVEEFNLHDPMHRLPRAHVVYVNIREQRHNLCRWSIPNEAGNAHEPRHCEFVSGFPPMRQADPSTLVTDIALQHFGRAEGEDLNYFRIGPPGEMAVGRPNVSNLIELTVNGYRNVTNRSLVHLATAAPFLRRIDFTGTTVNQRGIDDFKSLRPDVEVVFNEEVEEKKNSE
ncbi:uncharacterized protein LOC131845267 [Achroia grisella]|uniref:uncharacterized protein LOC131845267 n=1 Tax=Achroia grisella TaxID=688607 RepID=UPI0027D20F75|nr:uncharacterized protein LOC131845267 [Achroia grisella]